MVRVGGCYQCGQNFVSCGCWDKKEPFKLSKETIAHLNEISEGFFMSIELERLKTRVGELEAAIREHAAQRNDDRCFLDDEKLYKLVGIVGHPGLDLPEDEFLSNCKRYWKCQQNRRKAMTHLFERQKLENLS